MTSAVEFNVLLIRSKLEQPCSFALCSNSRRLNHLKNAMNTTFHHLGHLCREKAYDAKVEMLVKEQNGMMKVDHPPRTI